MADITLDGFHEPIVKSPIRRTGRGGGTIFYISKRVCNDYEIVEFNPNRDEANGNGEFHFVKLHKCLGTNRTVIIGNIYRSPAKKKLCWIYYIA